MPTSVRSRCYLSASVLFLPRTWLAGDAAPESDSRHATRNNLLPLLHSSINLGLETRTALRIAPEGAIGPRRPRHGIEGKEKDP